MALQPIRRAQIGSGVLGIIGALLLWGLGHGRLALPALGGVVWGILNVQLLGRLVTHVRPDRSPNVPRIAADMLLKFPAMYLIAYLLLRSQPREAILAAAAGFGLVLVVFLLRGLGVITSQRAVPSDPPRR